MVYIPLYASGEKETRKLYFFLFEVFFLASNIVQYTWSALVYSQLYLCNLFSRFSHSQMHYFLDGFFNQLIMINCCIGL
jgi:hypothetical protein